MEKKDLKWYDAPQVEVVEFETSVSLLAESDGTTNADGVIDGNDNSEFD